MKSIKQFLTICLCALALGANAQTDTEIKNVLFIGNSYTEVNNLPNLVQEVSRSAGYEITYQANTPGGCTFRQHCSNNSMNLIRRGGWDIVVLQAQSQEPSFPQFQVESETYPYAQQLVDSIYANNPDGEAMFYMTWGRKNGDPDPRNVAAFPVLGTYEGMDSMLYERYMYMARANDASVCPVGRVWRYLRTNNSDIELYSSDESHPSAAGSYAAACAFYTMIFHRDPLEIRFNYTLEESIAQTIRNAVHTVVFDNLDFWLRQTQAEDTTGNGQDTTGTGEDTTSYDTTQVSIVTIDQSNSCQVYPNPTTGKVTVKVMGNKSNGEIALFDMQGREILRRRTNGQDTHMDLSSLPQGVYLLRHTDNGVTTTQRIIKH